MQWLKNHAATLLVVVIPIAGYYYTVSYEWSYLQVFHVSSQNIQVNPVNIISAILATMQSLVFWLAVIILLLLLQILYLRSYQKRPREGKSKVIYNLIQKTRSPFFRFAILWLVLATAIPLTNSFQATKEAKSYLKDPLFAEINDKRYVVIRQYNDKLILQDKDNHLNAVVSSQYKIVDVTEPNVIFPPSQ